MASTDPVTGYVKQYGNILKIIIFILIFAVFVYLLYKLYNKIMLQIKLAQQKANVDTFYDENGNKYTIDLGAKAVEFYNAIYETWFWGVGEDEEKMLEVLLSVPREGIPKLESIYTSLFSKNMKDDAMKYLSDSEWKQVSYLFA